MSYEFRTVPDFYQLDVWQKTWQQKSHALFLEMGLGKTKLMLDTAGALYESGEIGAMLVVCPKGVLHTWVAQEIPAHLPERIPVAVACWRPSPNKTESAALTEVLAPTPALQVLVMNYDAFATQKGMAMAEQFM